MERLQNSKANCFLSTYSWFPVSDAPLDHMTQLLKSLVSTGFVTKDSLFHRQPVSGMHCRNLSKRCKKGPFQKERLIAISSPIHQHYPRRIAAVNVLICFWGTIICCCSQRKCTPGTGLQRNNQI